MPTQEDFWGGFRKELSFNHGKEVNIPFFKIKDIGKLITE